MSAPPQPWGPPHRQSPPKKSPLWFRLLMGGTLLFCFSHGATVLVTIAALVAAVLAALVVQVARNVIAEDGEIGGRLLEAADPLAAVQAESARHGGGVYLGVGSGGRWRTARPESAVLLLGPPRSGKTSAVMIPALLAHGGPAVSTSTKPDVLRATGPARGRIGSVWSFDPTGAEAVSPAVPLRWSPVTAAGSWDGALLMARAMVAGASVGAGTTDHTHWARRASALLAPLLHAAAGGGLGVDRVVDWVLCHELDEPGSILERAGAGLACGVLTGLANTEARERSSIFSAAADAVEAYTSQAALTAASDPNFDARRFVASCDAIYIHAPAENQALAAPLVCGLLAEIRRAAYAAHAAGALRAGVLFALDEVANIAPLAELPAIAAEGGGQGVTLIAAIQDLSQARVRWGPLADGFLTLFGAKLILPGVGDRETLEAVSVALGEYDRQVVSTTRGRGRDFLVPQVSRTTSVQRQRVLSPGEIANIPGGHALYLQGVSWELVQVTPAHRDEPWRTLTATPAAEAATAPTGTVR